VKFSQDFIAFACDKGVLRFGEFKTKAGRMSPYFFNAGLFDDGASLGRLCDFYADTILAADIPHDMLFGPAYKGIPLAAGTAIALARRGRNLPFCFNRKETKDHGEGGTLIGAPLAGRVLILDDVISAGTSIRESVNIIRAAGAIPAGVAVQEVQKDFGLPVVAVASLADLIGYLGGHAELERNLDAVTRYRENYGVN
jgi:orotate phosphoribosyltransferase